MGKRWLVHVIVLGIVASATLGAAEVRSAPLSGSEVVEPASGDLLVARRSDTEEARDKSASRRRQTVRGKLAVKQVRLGRPNSRASRFLAVGSTTCSGSGQPVEIATLAASLKCDPNLIFEYVYNNIEYEPLYGSNKGALGTLLDLRGDDIDQAQLLFALLQAAGFSPNFQSAIIQISGAQASGWLGVKNDAAAIEHVFLNGGINVLACTATGSPYPNCTGTLLTINVRHVWVQVGINGTNYVFDPSFKQHTVSTGVSTSLGNILGYSQSQFLTDAGGAIDNVSIANINRAKLRTDLVTYAANLISYVKNNNPGAGLIDIVGGKTILYMPSSLLGQTSLPYVVSSVQTWSTIPDTMRSCIAVTMPGHAQHNCNDPSSDTIVLHTDQYYWQRVTISSLGSSCTPPSGSCTPTLLVNGKAPPTGTNTGTAQAWGSNWTINVPILLPGTGFKSQNLTIAAGGTYLLASGWGQVGRGTVEKHRTLLTQAIAAGNPTNSEVVVGESLAIVGSTWLAEKALEQRLGDAIGGVTTQYPYAMGIVGYRPIQSTSSNGPYIDLPLGTTSVQPQTSYTGTGFSPAVLGSFYTDVGFGSSLESAVLEQTQALVPGIQAASTVRLIDVNATSLGSKKTFFADGTGTTGRDAYFNTIRANLSGYSDLSVVDCLIVVKTTSGCVAGNSPTGNQVLIPAVGNISIGTAPWTGWGLTISNQNVSAGTILVTQSITGGLSGGFSGWDIPYDTFSRSTDTQMIPPSANPTTIATLRALTPAPADRLISEPVDSITGAEVYEHTDITTGGGAFPYALAFGRSYTSSSNTRDIGLGNGWSHNYSISITRSSDPFAGLGESTVTDAAAAIAALYVSQNLLSGTLDAQHLTVAWMVDRWLTDQLTNNAATVTWPSTNEEFILLPHADGAPSAAYGAPPGSAVQLTGSSPDAYGNFQTFAYRNKDQSLLSFNPLNSSTWTGSLASWSMPYGVTVNFGYDGSGNLHTITNGLGRSLTLNYTGAHLTSITDDTNRTILFAYDSSNNLSTFSDPLNHQTHFAYDLASHLTQIFYPTNPSNAFVTNVYDAIGRVAQQANANGATTTFYVAGSRTEIVDPLSNTHVTYQTPRGKVIKDAYVLSSSFNNNVYNDTLQQDGVVNVWSDSYDGQDRLVTATLPGGGKTIYAYSLDFNNNITQVQNFPKSGSPLPATIFTYDPVFNEPTSIKDPLGLVSTRSYDPTSGNLLVAVADAGSGHLNATSTFTYFGPGQNGVGLVQTATDPLGVVTAYSYDSFGNQLTVTRDSAPAGSGHLNLTTQFGYDSFGDVNSLTDPNGNITISNYDVDRRLTSTTLPQVPSQPGPLVTQFTYDPDGRLLQTQQSMTSTTLRTTSSTYTSTGKIATTTDANGNVTQLSYDTGDRLSSVTDPLGYTTTYAYDAMNRQTQASNVFVQAGPLLQQAYKPDGMLASLTDANNNTTSYLYDGFDRLQSAIYPGGGSTETYTYDQDNNVTQRTTRANGTISYAYDTLNRLCAKTIGTTLPTCTTLSAATTNYAYDLDGRPTTISDGDLATIPSPSGAYTTYTTSTTYDQLNRPTGVSWNPAPAQTTSSTALVTFGHTYDGNNRRNGQSASDISWWNKPSTASTVSYTVNALNQYTVVGAASPTYDGNGNLSTDGSFTYCYDAENRMTGIWNASGSCASPNIATYAYDAQGRRKLKTVGPVGSATTTIYVTDADNREVLEYDGATGAIQRWYSFGLGPDDVLSQMNVAAGTRETFLPDIQGSTLATLDSSTGVLTKTAYRPYGESPGATSGTYLYTGRRFDPETAGSASQPSGTYYFRSREYLPDWGRFGQPDPIGYQGGANLYAYASDDPLNLGDPFGFAPDTPFGSGGVVGFANSHPAATLSTAVVVAAGAIACAAIEPCGATVIEALGLGGEAEEGYSARFGRAVTNDYRATFFKANPELEGQVVVHHAVEQQVLTRYPDVVSEAEMHSLENLRGVPNDLNNELHLGQIRREWNQFYRENPAPTKQQLLLKATEIDIKFGSQFNPPVGPGH